MKTSTSRILIAVRSHLAPNKREMMRRTRVANAPGAMTVRFFVGGKGDRPEPEIMTAGAPDTSHDLPANVPEFLGASPIGIDLRDSFDSLFNCADDTCIALTRLPAITARGVEHVGEALGINIRTIRTTWQ